MRNAEALPRILRAVEHLGEHGGQGADHRTHHQIQTQLWDADELIGRHDESMLIAQMEAGDRGRDHRRDDQRAEDVHRPDAQNDLHREDHAGNGGIEGSGDAGRGTAGEQDSAVVGVESQKLGETRTSAGRNLDDGPLAAHRATGSDGDRGG